MCGRTGTVMLYVPRSVFSCPPARPDEWACHDRHACRRRTRELGQWIGTRVLRRRDFDGTKWEIRRHDGVGMNSSRPWYVLTMQYRDHRLSSMHANPEAAKAHVDDLTASWRANSLRDYTGGRS